MWNVWRFGQMPEFPRLKIEIGQVKRNGGSTKQELLYVRCRCLLINEAFYVYVLKYARRWGCVWWWRNHQDLLQCFVLGVLEWRQNDSPDFGRSSCWNCTRLYHCCITIVWPFSDFSMLRIMGISSPSVLDCNRHIHVIDTLVLLGPSSFRFTHSWWNLAWFLARPFCMTSNRYGHS
jgi:hypothetical protein